jgi:hypothetical protein
MDQAGLQWFTSLANNEPKPANTVPGLMYMAKGAQGWVKDGRLLQKKEPGAKLMDFPAHWMVMWPFDSKTSGLPPCPRTTGVCIVWDGSPYASLAIFQNPTKLKMR